MCSHLSLQLDYQGFGPTSAEGPPPLLFGGKRPIHLLIFIFDHMQLLFRKDRRAVW